MTVWYSVGDLERRQRRCYSWSQSCFRSFDFMLNLKYTDPSATFSLQTPSGLHVLTSTSAAVCPWNTLPGLITCHAPPPSPLAPASFWWVWNFLFFYTWHRLLRLLCTLVSDAFDSQEGICFSPNKQADNEEAFRANYQLAAAWKQQGGVVKKSGG